MRKKSKTQTTDGTISKLLIMYMFMMRYSDNVKFKFSQLEEYVFLQILFTSHFVTLAKIPLYELILHRKMEGSP